MQVRIANRRAGGRAREALSPKLAAYDSLALRTSDSTDMVVPFESGEPAQPCRGVAGGRDGRRIGASPAVVSHARTGGSRHVREVDHAAPRERGSQHGWRVTGGTK